MARQLNNGKWNPTVYSSGCLGYMGMTLYVNGEWKIVECDTKEEAEQKEKEYMNFWKNVRI